MPRSSWSVAARRRARDRSLSAFAAIVLADPAAHSPLRVERVRQGLTAKELAAAPSLTSKAVYNVEAGRSPGTRCSRERLAAAVGVSVDALWPRVRP